MKPIHKLTALLALALGVSAGPASATSFTFSYLFGDGGVVSGSLDGTQNGNLVENVSNVAVSFNGTAMPGTVFASTYNDASSSFLTGAVVSFDVRQNNFFFANSDLAGGDAYGYDSIFYLTNAAAFGDVTAVGFSSSVPVTGFASQDYPAVGANWSLSPVAAAPVPEEGATVAFTGLAMVGLVLARRKPARG